MIGDNETKQPYSYDKTRQEVILEELDTEEAKIRSQNEIGSERQAMLYMALHDDSESVTAGYEIRRPIPGLSPEAYRHLWTWIEAETARRKILSDTE